MSVPGQDRRCDGCGAVLAENAHFCPMCGTSCARAEGDPLLGITFADRYRLEARIGQGGSGSVYRADDVGQNRKVAVKVLHLELTTDALSVERFRREATTVGGMKNEHILHVVDFGSAPDGRLFLVMEYLEGETLFDLLAREGPRPIAQIVDILDQLGAALMEAHALGYVHRDLRPRNVFLSNRDGRKGFVKLLDFGLSKLVEKEGSAAATQVGMTFGDPSYMSPEQAHGQAIDRRSDLYSLGIITYEMLVGKPPFHGDKVFDVLTQHLETPPVPPSKLRSDIPEWLRALVLCTLAKNPEERFITVYRMLEVLHHGRTAAQARANQLPPAVTAMDAPAVIPTGGIDLAALPPVSAPKEQTAGMSGMWYADGEALSSITASGIPKVPLNLASSSIVRDDFYEEPKRIKPTVVVGGAVGVLLLAFLTIVFWPSPKGDQQEDAGAAKFVRGEVPDAGGMKPVVTGFRDAAIARNSIPTRSAPVVKGMTLPPPPVIDFRPKPDAASAKVAPGSELSEVSDTDAAQSEFYVKLGQQSLRQGDMMSAAANFNKARQFSPRSPEAIAGLGQAALQQGYFDDSIVHLREAARLAPSSAHLQALLGKAYLGSGNAKLAAQTFKKALKLDPDNDMARKGYGDAVSQGGE